MKNTEPLERVEELVARRYELLKRIEAELNYTTKKSLRIELRQITGESRRLISFLTDFEDWQEISEAVTRGLKYRDRSS